MVGGYPLKSSENTIPANFFQFAMQSWVMTPSIVLSELADKIHPVPWFRSMKLQQCLPLGTLASIPR